MGIDKVTCRRQGVGKLSITMTRQNTAPVISCVIIVQATLLLNTEGMPTQYNVHVHRHAVCVHKASADDCLAPEPMVLAAKLFI